MSKQANNLEPVYFFVGEDALKRSVLEDRLRTRIAALGDIDFNSDTFDGAKAKASDIIASCETMPFLSDYRLVTLRQPEALSTAEQKAIAGYLASPCETTVLALSSAGFEARSPLAKAFAAAPRNAVVDCSIGDIANLVRSLATGHGVTIDPAAARTLIDLAGSDTVHLDAELQKLALAHVGNEPISAREVQELISPLAAEEFKPWEFLDALSARDAAKCFRILAGVDEAELIRLLSLSVGRLKELLAASSSVCPNASALAAAIGKKDWQVKKHHRWVRSIPPHALEEAIIFAAETEMAMKSGTNPRDAFCEWLCSYFSRVLPSPRR